MYVRAHVKKNMGCHAVGLMPHPPPKQGHAAHTHTPVCSLWAVLIICTVLVVGGRRSGAKQVALCSHGGHQDMDDDAMVLLGMPSQEEDRSQPCRGQRSLLHAQDAEGSGTRGSRHGPVACIHVHAPCAMWPLAGLGTWRPPGTT